MLNALMRPGVEADDDFIAGWKAAKAGQPFQTIRSESWQSGWLHHRRDALATTRSPQQQAEVAALLSALRTTMARLANRGTVEADLAIAAAHQTFVEVTTGSAP